MRFFFIGVILLLLSACISEPDCYVTATNHVKIDLFKLGTDSTIMVTFSSITASGTDSTFEGATAVSSLVLPVNPGSNQTTFKFTYERTVNSVLVTKKDSITLNYVKQNIIISPACGAYVYYSNLAVLSSSFVGTPLFSNPKVVNGQLSTSATVNLQIKL